MAAPVASDSRSFVALPADDDIEGPLLLLLLLLLSLLRSDGLWLLLRCFSLLPFVGFDDDDNDDDDRFSDDDLSLVAFLSVSPFDVFVFFTSPADSPLFGLSADECFGTCLSVFGWPAL